MNKGLEALNKIKEFIYYECVSGYEDVMLSIEKELKRLEELEKAFVALSKDDEEAKKLLSKEIEKNKELNEVLDFIKSNIAYTRALCDRTKNPDNDLICFDIRGLVNEETWRKIYEAIGTPII